MSSHYLSDVKVPEGNTVCFRGEREPLKILSFQERGHIYYKRPNWFESSCNLTKDIDTPFSEFIKKSLMALPAPDNINKNSKFF